MEAVGLQGNVIYLTNYVCVFLLLAPSGIGMTVLPSGVNVINETIPVNTDDEPGRSYIATAEMESNLARHARSVDDGSGCQEPTEHELRGLLDDAIHYVTRVGELNPEEEYERLMTSIRQLDHSSVQCHLLHTPILHELPLNRVTNCPWVEVADVNPHRYPREITYAVCSCTHCIDMTQPSRFSGNDCRHVYIEQPMLKRGNCVNNKYSYSLHEEPVSVGCVCDILSE